MNEKYTKQKKIGSALDISPVPMTLVETVDKGSLFRTLLLSCWTEAYLSSLALVCHIDLPLQPYVNIDGKGIPVGQSYECGKEKRKLWTVSEFYVA